MIHPRDFDTVVEPPSPRFPQRARMAVVAAFAVVIVIFMALAWRYYHPSDELDLRRAHFTLGLLDDPSDKPSVLRQTYLNLTEHDVAGARVIGEEDHARVAITFTPDGAGRWRALLAASPPSRVVFVLADGTLWSNLQDAPIQGQDALEITCNTMYACRYLIHAIEDPK